MSTTVFTNEVGPSARIVALLNDILDEIGGSMSFDAQTPPDARTISLLTEIRDALAGQGLPAGILGDGVTGITFLLRPRGEAADPVEMTGYIVHGAHVVSFVRNDSGNYAPALSGAIYELQLDRAYEPDEVAVFVWPGAFDGFHGYVIDTASQTGAWSGSGPDINGVVHLPQVWQTGPNGDKSMRLIIPVSLTLNADGSVTWSGNHSDPLCIMLVFLDRTAADVRDPALP